MENSQAYLKAFVFAVPSAWNTLPHSFQMALFMQEAPPAYSMYVSPPLIILHHSPF